MTQDISLDNTVIFQGDGEPKTPSMMLQQLAAFDQEFTLETDSYSLGGNVEQLEKNMCRNVRQGSGSLYADGYPRQPSCHP